MAGERERMAGERQRQTDRQTETETETEPARYVITGQRIARAEAATPRAQIQESAFLVQTVRRLRFLAASAPAWTEHQCPRSPSCTAPAHTLSQYGHCIRPYAMPLPPHAYADPPSFAPAHE
eukprot:3907016-Rhodomonas_salina.1